MGRAGKILLAVTLAAVLVFAYALVSAQLSATLVSAVAEGADTRVGTFDELAEALARGDLSAVQYKELQSREAADYAFVTYTVELKGLNLMPAEWAVISLTPLEGDVVLIQGAPQDMASFGNCTLSASLLTRRDLAQAQRELWVEYYVLGQAHSATVRGRGQ